MRGGNSAVGLVTAARRLCLLLQTAFRPCWWRVLPDFGIVLYCWVRGLFLMHRAEWFVQVRTVAGVCAATVDRFRLLLHLFLLRTLLCWQRLLRALRRVCRICRSRHSNVLLAVAALAHIHAPALVPLYVRALQQTLLQPSLDHGQLGVGLDPTHGRDKRGVGPDPAHGRDIADVRRLRVVRRCIILQILAVPAQGPADPMARLLEGELLVHLVSVLPPPLRDLLLVAVERGQRSLCAAGRRAGVHHAQGREFVILEYFRDRGAQETGLADAILREGRVPGAGPPGLGFGDPVVVAPLLAGRRWLAQDAVDALRVPNDD